MTATQRIGINVIRPTVAFQVVLTVLCTCHAAAAPASQPADAFHYRALTIVSPEDNSAFWRTGGTLSIKVRATPPLSRERGDRIRVYMDRRLAGEGNEVNVGNVARGAHRVHAEIVAADGSLLIKSPVVHFTLHRNSILLPER